jgi:hypothetical protein
MDTLTEIMELLYMNQTDCEQLTVRIGIWDAKSPYTVYATLHDGNGNVQAGEDSYGSDTVKEALTILVENVRKMVQP